MHFCNRIGRPLLMKLISNLSFLNSSRLNFKTFCIAIFCRKVFSNFEDTRFCKCDSHFYLGPTPALVLKEKQITALPEILRKEHESFCCAVAFQTVNCLENDFQPPQGAPLKRKSVCLSEISPQFKQLLRISFSKQQFQL